MVEAANCEPKVWWRSKTVWISILMFIIWCLSILDGLTDNKIYTAILALITLVLGLVLRWLTGSPITLRDLEAAAQAAIKAKAEWEARSNPSSMKPAPWPAPNMDGTPFEEKPGPPPGYIEKGG